MTRYIDADKIKKEILFSTSVSVVGTKDAFILRGFAKQILQLIDQNKTADVVEVVRCKNCKHKGGNGYDEDVCWEIEPQHGVYVSDNWYCADGERRE